MLPGPGHDGGNEHHLDQHGGECQDQRAVGITQPMGQMFGLIYDSEGADQNSPDDEHERNDQWPRRDGRLQQGPVKHQSDDGAAANPEPRYGGTRDDGSRRRGNHGLNPISRGPPRVDRDERAVPSETLVSRSALMTLQDGGPAGAPGQRDSRPQRFPR